MATVVRKNKYARILSHARGASYEVQERVKNKWETVTEFYGNRSTAIHLYNRLTKHKKKQLE